jgi:DNA uptake protein ComE-like DNA-binding protein
VKPIGPMPRRRGAIFVMALAVIVVLTGLVLVFAQNMRTQATASANRCAYIQADAVEQGAEKWVLAQVEDNLSSQSQTQGVSPSLNLQQVPAQALQVGDGYFWVITPNPTTDQQLTFGITDESSKLNINTVSSSELLNMPNITQDIATAITDWRSSGGGQESSYYSTLAEPYQSKGTL